jgi:protein-S-isoprenylcysteine O-methyltransferase Ste14
MKKTKIGKTLEFLVLIALPFLTHVFFPVIIIIQKPYSYLGILLMLIGVYAMVKTSILFRKAGNSFTLKDKSSELIKSEIFKYSRNPMYLGMLLFLLGLAVILGSLTSFIYPLIFFIFANLMIPYEEKKLEQLYGYEYLNYKRSVRRWI